jgi:hypothetical protein
MMAVQPSLAQRVVGAAMIRLTGDRGRLLLGQQRRIERQHRRMRTDLLRSDRSERQLNAFTGRGE